MSSADTNGHDRVVNVSRKVSKGRCAQKAGDVFFQSWAVGCQSLLKTKETRTSCAYVAWRGRRQGETVTDDKSNTRVSARQPVQSRPHERSVVVLRGGHWLRTHVLV